MALARQHHPSCKPHPARTFGFEDAEAVAGAMLVACRLAGLSALEGHYADINARAMRAETERGRPGPTYFAAPKTAENRRDVGRADPKTPGLKS